MANEYEQNAFNSHHSCAISCLFPEGQVREQNEERNVVSVLYDRSMSTLKEVIRRLQDKKSSTEIVESVDAICKGYHDETTVCESLFKS